MKKNAVFFTPILFITINVYAEENIFNRIFFEDFAKAGKVIVENPVTSLLSLSSAGLITIAIMSNDLIIKDYFDCGRSEFSDRVFDVFNLAGDGITVLAFNSFLFLFGEKEKNTAEKVIEAVTTAGATTYILKIITGRQRPADADDRYNFSPFSLRDSFPSGHATVAFAWATVIAENYGIWYITYPLAIMGGLARIYKDMHWASDVFVGSIIGTFFGKVVCIDTNSHIFISTKSMDDISMLMVNLKY